SLRRRRSRGHGPDLARHPGGAARLLARPRHARDARRGRRTARAAVRARLLPSRRRRHAGRRGGRERMKTRASLVGVLALVGSARAVPYLRKPARGHGFQTQIDPYTVGPGQDLEVCEYRRLANEKTAYVSGFKLRMPLGAHHFALWRYGGKIPA